jgi:hypothetical protein
MMGYITTLDASKPIATDPVAEGAAEIRMIKETLKDTFPSASGPLRVSNEAIAVTLQEIIPDMQREIDDLKRRVFVLESELNLNP